MYTTAQRKAYAKSLRKHQTPAERALWPLFFVGFRPQVITPSKYVADWYNKSARVCVELDGGPHYTSKGRASDGRRDKHHKAKGVLTIRVNNGTATSRRGMVISYIISRSLIHLLYVWFIFGMI